MSHKLRNDNVCLNCDHVVEHRYCSYCGQENIHPNETVYSLFQHFHGHTEDYQVSLWGTIKKLLFRPGFLTKEYILGKRKKFTHPVRIYLLISFIYFFLIMGVLDRPTVHKYSAQDPESQIIIIPLNLLGFLHFEVPLYPVYNSVAAYDSIQLNLPVDKRDKGIYRFFHRRSANIYEQYKPEKASEILGEKINQTIPKAFFILIPLLAFWIWLLNNKKKYKFSNHLIFCIHFNSLFFIILGINTIIDKSVNLSFNFQFSIFAFLMSIITIYFIAAIRRVYEQPILLAIIKGGVILTLQMIFILLAALALICYIFLTI